MVQKIGWLKIVSGYQLLVQFPDFLENASIHFKKYFYSFSKYLVPDMYHGSVIPAQIKKKKFIPPLWESTIDRKWKNFCYLEGQLSCMQKNTYWTAPATTSKLKQPC